MLNESLQLEKIALILLNATLAIPVLLLIFFFLLLSAGIVAPRYLDEETSEHKGWFRFDLGNAHRLRLLTADAQIPVFAWGFHHLKHTLGTILRRTLLTATPSGTSLSTPKISLL